jgi:Flp pilus assembly protein TadG
VYSKLFAVERSFAGRLRRLLARLLRDDCGSQIVLIALLVPVLVGAAALTVDGGVWGYDQLTLQSAADSAAISAARVYTDNTSANLTVEAEAVVAQYCSQTVCPSPTVTVYNPPQVGGGNCSLAATDPYIGNSNAFEVVVTQPAARTLSAIFGNSSSVTLCARSVACSSTSSGSCSNAIVASCVLALATTGTGITISGNNISVQGCGLVSNSSVACSGNNQSISGPLTSVGSVSGCSVSGQEFTVPSPGIADPYAATSSSWPATCTGTACGAQTNCAPGNSCSTAPPSCPGYSFCPGVYSAGITLGSNNTSYTMAPGVYYVGGSGLSITANSVTLSGTGGVTMVFTGQNGVATSKNNTTLALTAPASGWNDGISLWQPCAVGPCTGFSGGKNNLSDQITGAIYMPKSSVVFDWNNGGVACTQIIAQTITLDGNNIGLSGNCSNVAGGPPKLINQSPILVE